MASAHRLQVVLNHLQTPLHPSVKSRLPMTKAFLQWAPVLLDNNFLTDQQRAFYEENGFILFPKFIEDELLDECRQRFVGLCNGQIDKGGMVLMKDKSLMRTNAKGEFLYNKVQDIFWDEVLSKYILHPKILKFVECITGADITAVHSMLINKPPDSGKLTSAHPIHQDLYYFNFRPANKMVASWTAMEKTTVDNGCLYFIPGTHKSALQPHGYPENDVNAAYHGITGFDLVPRINLEMEKGDTVFFHPLIIHGSGPNFSKGFRKAISCHYASNDCYFIDIKGTLQEEVAKEIILTYKNKGLDVSYEAFWKMRQRVIKGTPGTLN